MQWIVDIFNYIQSLGVVVFMPIIITILGVLFGVGFGKSLKAGLTVGVGFLGLNLVINQLLGTSLTPAIQGMIERFGFGLSIIDVGWPATAAIALGSTVGIIIIPVGFLVNILMLITNTTQTVNVDIWNYWHFAFSGALAAILTDNIIIGVYVAIVNMIIIMVLGDITAPQVEKSLGLEGVSLPHGFTTAYAPIAMLFNWIFDHIPGIRDIDINVENVQERLGVFGEPIMLGTIIGFLIGILAGYDFAGILLLAVSLGGVLVLIPQMAQLLMEGLLPISDAAREYINKRFSNRGKIYIGLDSAVGVGHPVTLTIAYILLPLSIFIAIILPGNQVMPFTDLSVLPYMFVLITPIVGNNAFRGIIIGIISLIAGLYISTDLAPFMTQAATNVGFQMPEGATMISSICDGANPLSWALIKGSDFGTIGLILIGVFAVIMAVWNRSRIIKEAKMLQEEGTAA